MNPLQTLSLAAFSTGVALCLSACGDSGHDSHDHDDHDHAEHDHGAHDHEEHDHSDEKVVQHPELAGPNGGRVIASVEPHLEFLVTEDREVEIRSLDDSHTVQPLAEQSVTVLGGDRSNPTRMTFAKVDDVLVSDVAFPEGNDFPVVVQITPAPEADKVVSKFNLNLSDCPTCDFREYACICEHATHSEGDGHNHDHD